MKITQPLRGKLRITGPFKEDRGDRIHWGIDFACPIGTPVYNVYEGEVVLIRDDKDKKFGLWCVVKSVNDGVDWYFFYTHLSVCLVTNGDNVLHEQKIGLSGNSGDSSGPHLHFQVMKNTALSKDQSKAAVDPLSMMRIERGECGWWGRLFNNDNKS